MAGSSHIDLLTEARPLLTAAVRDGLGSAAAAGAIGGAASAVFACGRTSRVGLQTGPALDGRWVPRPGLPVSTDSPFDLASLTKPMVTATLLALLLSAPHPRLSLDQRLDHWLAAAKGTVLGAATLQQLMAHASGAQAWRDLDAATAGISVPRHRVEAIAQQVLNAPLAHPPNYAALYSDLGYLALGWVLQEVLEQRLDEAFATHIARPLGLHAHFRPKGETALIPAWQVVCTEVWPRRCADGQPLQGEVHDDNAAALGGVAGHAGLFGSVRDVLRWAEVWLDATNSARPAPALPLSRAICRQLITTAMAPGATWRCGWDTPSQPGSLAGALAPPDTFGHLGFTGTSVWLSPAKQTAVVLLTNRVHPSRDPATAAAALPALPAHASIRWLRPAVADAVWAAASGR